MKKHMNRWISAVGAAVLLAGALLAGSSDALAEKKCGCLIGPGGSASCHSTATTVTSRDGSIDYIDISGGSTFLRVDCFGCPGYNGNCNTNAYSSQFGYDTNNNQTWEQEVAQVYCPSLTPTITMVKCGGYNECKQPGNTGCF